MRRFGEFFRNVAAPALIACWIAYMGYGAVAGAAGYRALDAVNDEIAREQAELDALRARRQALEVRADQLNPRSLDPDMVDERVRAVLGYARPGDIVIPRAEVERMTGPGTGLSKSQQE